MKHFVTVFLLLAICLTFVFLLSSCGGSDKTASTTGNGTPNEPEAKTFQYNLFSDEGLLCVVRNSKCGYINPAGQEVIPCKYYAASNFQNGYAIVQEKSGDPYYFIKPDGTKLLDTPFSGATLFDSQGRAVIKKSQNGKCELIDKDGKSYMTAQAISSGDNGLYLFMDEDNLCGVADKDGTVLIDPRYDGMDFIHDQFILFNSGDNHMTCRTDLFLAYRKVSSGTYQYVIDLNGKELYSADTTCKGITYETNSQTFCAHYPSKVVLFGSDGKVVKTIEEECESVGFFLGGFGLVYKSQSKEEIVVKMIDAQGTVGFNSKTSGYVSDDVNLYGDVHIRSSLSAGGKSGLADGKTGKILIPVTYDWVDSDGFDENGICFARKTSNEYVALDRTGKTVFSKSCDGLERLAFRDAPYYIAEYEVGGKTSYELLDAKGVVLRTFGTKYDELNEYGDGFGLYDDGYIVCRETESGNIAIININNNYELVCLTIYDNIIR